MPAATRRISPARSMSWWLMTSASAGASFKAGKKSWDRFMASPLALLVGEDAEQIVVKGGEHERYQEKEAHLSGDFLFPRADRVPPDAFLGEKQDVPAVQHGDREQVEDAQADAQHRHQ